MSEYVRCPHCRNMIDLIAVYDVAPSAGEEKDREAGRCLD